MELHIKINTNDGDEFAQVIDELTTIFSSLYESDDDTVIVPTVLLDETHIGGTGSTSEPEGEQASGIGSAVEFREDYSQFNATELASDPLDVPAAEELDDDNLPWNSRINTASKLKVKKTGLWKVIRNLDPAFVEQVKAELRATMGATAPATTATPATIATPDAAAIFGGGNAVAQQPAAVTIPTPPGVQQQAVATIPTPPGVTTPLQEEMNAIEVDPFPAFIMKISTRVATPEIGPVFNTKVSELLQSHGIAAVPLLMHKKELIPAFDLELENIWNSLNTHG